MTAAAAAETAQPLEQPLVHAVNVSKSFHHNEVLKGIDLDVNRGQVVCLLGPSGSGKTTFLRCINQLETINGGRIWVDGDLMGYAERDGKLYRLKNKEIAAQRREIGMVFQRFNLFPHKTAIQNVTEAPIQVGGLKRKQAREDARALLDRVGLADHADKYPGQLSGGQQQRVAVARAVAGEPLILLADEPTGNLDSRSGEAVMDLLRELHRAGATICMVTHDPRYARHADRSIHVFDGRVVEESTQTAPA